MRKRKGARLAWVVALGLAAAACGGEAPRNGTPPANEFRESGLSVVSVELGTSVGSDLKVNDNNPLDEFTPEQTIYASVATRGSSADATLEARWTYEDSVPVTTSSTRFRPNGPKVAEFHISHPRGLLPGRYKVEILLDGKVVQSKAFRIKAPSGQAGTTSM